MEKLNPEQIDKLKIFIDKINEVEGKNIVFEESTLALLTGTYNIIEKMGGGDPLKAAEWRLKGSQTLK